MTNALRTAASLLAAILLMAGQAMALTSEETAVLTELTDHLRGIKTMQGEFVQYGPDGGKAQGDFYLARPGKVHFRYDPPTKIRVIADGKSVLVHDRGLKTFDLYPLSKTPLKHLLADDLDLADPGLVNAVSIDDDLISVVIIDDGRFGGGRLTLVFDRNSYALRQWTVRDAQGLNTSVSIYNAQAGNKLPARLFRIDYSAARQANRNRRSAN